MSLAGESAADVDQRAGADADGGAAAGRGVCRHGGGAALDGASAGGLHACICLPAFTSTWDRDGMNRELSGLMKTGRST